MVTIKMHRTNENNNRMRDFKIFIDGRYVGKMETGEMKSFTTTAGQHSVKAKIDWCSSPDILIDVKDDEEICLKISGFKNSNWIMPIAGAIIAIHFILKMTLNIEYLIFLIIPAFILLTYYLTIGRNKYLTIVKI